MACQCQVCRVRRGEVPGAAAAIRKARRLLHSHLNDAQLRSLKNSRRITVTGNVTGHKYRILNNGWVYRVFDGHGFCLDVFEQDEDEDDEIPTPDKILAKKILIEADEYLFLKTANEDNGDWRGR